MLAKIARIITLYLKINIVLINVLEDSVFQPKEMLNFAIDVIYKKLKLLTLKGYVSAQSGIS